MPHGFHDVAAQRGVVFFQVVLGDKGGDAGFVFLAASTAGAAKLKPQAVEGWDRYVALTEARIDREQRDLAHFLWIDLMPEEQRRRAEAQLKSGQVVIDKLRTEDQGTPIKTPGALIHHWIGIAFIPKATVQQALALVQDYNNHYKVYKPEVERSQLISRNGNYRSSKYLSRRALFCC